MTDSSFHIFEELLRALLSKICFHHGQDDWGDRCQTLVLIGHKMDKKVVKKALMSALLTKAEVAQGPEAWSCLLDPIKVEMRSA